jgi:hypothetical protein
VEQRIELHVVLVRHSDIAAVRGTLLQDRFSGSCGVPRPGTRSGRCAGTMNRAKQAKIDAARCRQAVAGLV